MEDVNEAFFIPEKSMFYLFVYLYLFIYLCCFLGLQMLHMEVPRLGVESELYLLAHTTVTAMQDPSHVCNLHYSSWQRLILNPLSETRDRTCILMDTSQVC